MACDSISPVAFGSEGVPSLRPEVRPATIAAAAAPSHTGQSFPLGATVCPGGVNFSVFSRRATRVELLLFDSAADAQPTRVIALDPRKHRTYHYWHVFVPGIGAGQLYAYRAVWSLRSRAGPAFRSEQGSARPVRARRCRARGVFPVPRRADTESETRIAMKSAVVDPGAYDWEGDAPLRRPFCLGQSSTRCTSRGFTRHPSSGSCRRRRAARMPA